MKKIAVVAAFAALLTSGALAQDRGVVSVPTPAGMEPVLDWTGPYVGVFGAASQGQSRSVFEIPGPPSLTYIKNNDKSTGLAGVQIGYDHQVNSFVFGAVADIALSGFEVGYRDPFLGVEYSSKLEYLGTVRARAGFLPTDSLLIYAHAGLAYGRFAPVLNGGLVPVPDLRAANRIGWTAGVGLEYAITRNISVQAEYSYTDFGTATAIDAAMPTAPATESLKLQTVKAGINFRF
ncbi:outer membrane protein [Paradevosia shaoguanensis]|uniref:outer membrane protein n=1 Tax=Paradevosia shaoguanensis TaxID=1335043 RepID=UPI0019320C06|nr:outer membrane protein [Paradevosia shaoguanensis]